ncbi:hypothetical protein L916_08373 [Phytophthora nicotianae]|uniref:Uncharacterized protein n=1 Tax=Phytophthora nicotianae TaxID=4792 RepID=W2J3V4_PHYNI|nr:hypothetical protein L916_08373 [Phytophthora nicotianae]
MEIYSGFASSELSDTLTELVELRWNACEQPLFIDGDSGLRDEMFKWIRGEYTTSRSADFSDDSVVMFWDYMRALV